MDSVPGSLALNPYLIQQDSHTHYLRLVSRIAKGRIFIPYIPKKGTCLPNFYATSHNPNHCGNLGVWLSVSSFRESFYAMFGWKRTAGEHVCVVATWTLEKHEILEVQDEMPQIARSYFGYEVSEKRLVSFQKRLETTRVTRVTPGNKNICSGMTIVTISHGCKGGIPTCASTSSFVLPPLGQWTILNTCWSCRFIHSYQGILRLAIKSPTFFPGTIDTR